MIEINQQTVLKWFNTGPAAELYLPIDIEPILGNPLEPAFTSQTFYVLIQAIWQKMQYGLAIKDLDNILIIITALRFLILTIRYNVYSSVLITLTSTFAAFLWYRHLIVTMLGYLNIMDPIPGLRALYFGIAKARSISGMRNLPTSLNTPYKVLKYAWTTGTVSGEYRIDPISMFVAKWQDLGLAFGKSLEFAYYSLTRCIIPISLNFLRAGYKELGAFAAYTTITRMGKRYCPYLIRWHWTMHLMTHIVEGYLVRVQYRLSFFKNNVLITQHREYMENLKYLDPNEYRLRMSYYSAEDYHLVTPMLRDAYLIKYLIIVAAFLHCFLIVYFLLHAVAGQYFYLPFFTENVELNIGPREKNSIYSGGLTAWQEEGERKANINRKIPKLWYGWFSRGTTNQKNIFTWLYICILFCLKWFVKLLRLESPLKKIRKKLKMMLKKGSKKKKKK